MCTYMQFYLSIITQWSWRKKERIEKSHKSRRKGTDNTIGKQAVHRVRASQDWKEMHLNMYCCYLGVLGLWVIYFLDSWIFQLLQWAYIRWCKKGCEYVPDT